MLCQTSLTLPQKRRAVGTAREGALQGQLDQAQWRGSGHTLQKGHLDILSIHGHTAPMLQLHQVAVQVWQADGDRAGTDSIRVISTLPRGATE